MTELTFGLNLNFAVKRWPETDAWAAVVRDVGLTNVQFAFDLWDTSFAAGLGDYDAIRAVAEREGISIHSAFSGFIVYSQNFLGHPDAGVRERSEQRYREMIKATARLGARAFGGHMGAISVRSAADPVSRRQAIHRTVEAVLRLSEEAQKSGLEALLWEVMAVEREWPSTLDATAEMLERCAGSSVPVELCLDLGHAVTAGSSGDDRDPYAWMRQFLPHAWCLHLQQTDGLFDRHWPFTAEHNAQGIITSERVLDEINRCGRDHLELMLEPVPAVELADDRVLSDVRDSVDFWRPALSEIAPNSFVSRS